MKDFADIIGGTALIISNKSPDDDLDCPNITMKVVVQTFESNYNFFDIPFNYFGNEWCIMHLN